MASRLDAFSAYPFPNIATLRCSWRHNRYTRGSVQHGPLVLVSALFNIPTPATDRDRTVLRRSEPSSRATLMGEQPNPWDLLQPQDVTSRHRGAKPLPSIWALGGGSACYPRSTFYPLSDMALPCGTMPDHFSLAFATCSTRRSLSQAPLY